MKVHILATVRHPDLLPAAILVFKTIRTGFPNSEIVVWMNSMPNAECSNYVQEAAKSVGAVTNATVDGAVPWNYGTLAPMHHEWICKLLESERSAFWICDTDMAFWDKVEDMDFSGVALAGRLVPEFYCSFARAVTISRLHTCLLWIDPLRVKEFVGDHFSQIPEAYCLPRPTVQGLVHPRYVPRRVGSRKQTYFFDTASQLYQVTGGHHFNETENARWDHVNFATISDLVAPSYPDQKFRESHFAIFENHELLRGAWKDQQKFYAERAV